MKINEAKIEEIINKYDKIIRATGAFFLEVDQEELTITDACEGVDMVPLDKNMCLKLSELFRELSEQL